MRPRDRGFSLIELLIVVAIILIIAAVAIPNLLRSRIAANQASAVQSCRVINSAEVAYSTTYSQGFSSTLLQLGPPSSGAQASPSAAGLIDSVLAAGTKNGYTITYTPDDLDARNNYEGYRVNADPTLPGTTGNAHYFTDQSYVIRGSYAGSAAASDSAVAQ